MFKPAKIDRLPKMNFRQLEPWGIISQNQVVIVAMP